jgi:XTP/dITP diphosphohydrolase
MKIVFASNNVNKVREIQLLIPKNIEILSLKDIGCLEDIPETSDTIEGNAILKANYVTQHYGYDCFADDSGLEVVALNGNPGVHSARYAGEQKNDDDNMKKLLSVLKNETNRKGQFKTVIALNTNCKQHLFTGIVEGEIAHQKIGTRGFGYDPIFIPNGHHKTFGQFEIEEKNAISHRAKAVRLLVYFLTTLSH